MKMKDSVYIIGESPLVEEFAEVCAAHGFSIVVQWNKAPKRIFFTAKSIKRSNVIPKQTLMGVELTNTDLARKKANLQKLDRAFNASKVLLSSSVTVTVTQQASWIRRQQRLVGISALPTLLSQKLIEFSAALETRNECLSAAQAFFMQLGKQISGFRSDPYGSERDLVPSCGRDGQDRIGMVLPRILCMIINEAYFALQEKIARPEDIDAAMRLGTNYPYGPIEWGEKIGLVQVRAVLEALQRDLAEERYRIAPLLKQMAIAGQWWSTR